MKTLNKNTKDIIESLLEDGFSYEQIMMAFEDGEFLRKENLTQDEAELGYDFCSDKVS